MNPSGDFGRYHCFDHGIDFDEGERKEAAKHLINKHDMTNDQALAKLDEIDEMYDEMDDYDEDIQ